MTVENGELYGAQACPNGMDSPRQLRMTLPAADHSVRLSRYATRAVLTAWQLSHVYSTPLGCDQNCSRSCRSRKLGSPVTFRCRSKNT